MTLREYIDTIKNKKVAVIGIGVSNTPHRPAAGGGRVRHRLRQAHPGTDGRTGR